ncbi:MAG: RDD family protein [Acidobacteria bacterium]|nr:RDD family protein [Acidobacteriota bacterium]
MSDVIRCPYCEKYIDVTFNPITCAKCGEALAKDESGVYFTNETLDSDFNAVPRVVRLFATGIDLAVALASIMLSLVVADRLFPIRSWVGLGLATVTTLTMIFVYPSLMERYSSGATLGKMVFGVRVIDVNSLGPPSLQQALGRNILKVVLASGLFWVSMAFGGIPFIVAILYPDIWSIHNKASNSLVVYK